MVNWNFITAAFLTMEAVAGQPIKRIKFSFEFPRVFPGHQLMAKEHEDSGYEIPGRSQVITIHSSSMTTGRIAFILNQYFFFVCLFGSKLQLFIHS